MLGSGFGGYVWSDHQAQPTTPYSYQAMTTAIFGSAIGAALIYGTHTRPDGTRPIDTVIEAARWAGNRSPVQIGNTLRIPEFLSPLASPVQQGLDFVENTGKYEFVWGPEFLRNRDTFAWLQYVTGKNMSQLNAAGLSPFKDSVPNTTRLVFSRDAETSAGALYIERAGGARTQIARDIALFHMSTHSEPLVTHGSMNKAAHAVIQASGVMDDGVIPDRVFKHKQEYAKYLPIPWLTSSPTLPVRTALAFGAERFNRLIGGIVEQTFGKTASSTFEKVTGFSLNVKSGTATQLIGRFGTRAAGLGAVVLGAQQLDWIRNEYGILGHVSASAAFSGLAGYSLLRAGYSRGVTGIAATGLFAVQALAPGFRQGILPGLATTYANVAKVRAIDANPFGIWRRTLEGFFPGVTSFQTGVLLGAGVAAAAYLQFGAGRSLPQLITEEYLDTTKLFDTKVPIALPKTVKQLYKQELEIERFKFDTDDMAGSFAKMNKAWEKAEAIHRTEMDDNPINSLFIKRLKTIAGEHAGGGALNNFWKQVKGIGAQFKYSFFGADPVHDTVKKAAKNLGFMRPIGRMGRLASLFAITLGAHQLVTGGLLGSMESSSELDAIFRGDKLVEVKKSRWWEGGGTPFEGDKTKYFRPHVISLMLNRTRETGIWGEDEARISPIRKFLTKNFTYELEKQNYWTRPYPMTSAAFADVPIVGGLLASTVGRMFKPPKLMHTGEWIQEGPGGNMEYAHVYEGAWREPAYALGAPGPGIPMSPYSPAAQAAFLSYQFRELEGLTGFVKNTVQNALTGSEGYLEERPVLADASLMTSPRVKFWEMNLGGFFFSNEAVRRLLPKYKYEVKRENPIVNNMPAWLPDKFRYGDPYRTVEWGEARLPGAGYATLHPELKGVAPDDYPLVYKYKILADVAPWSKELRRVRETIYMKRARGLTLETENQEIDQIDERLAKVYNIKDFERVSPHAIELPGSSITQSLWFSSQSLVRKVVAPVEYLIPFGFRPVQKLMNDRDPIEQYEYERLYGTQMSFWDEPWRDWFRPAMYSAANMLGYEGKPLWRAEADANQEYFDKLELVKWMDIADAATAAGDYRTKYRALTMASRTRAGTNPQGNPLGIYWSLPMEERAFYNAFATATGRDRERILEMVPQDQQHLYQATWSRLDAGDPTMYLGSPAQVDEQFLRQSYSGATQYLNGQPSPREDWIGWHQDVDMGDIRVRYINQMGKDFHDFGLWESQLHQSMRQPFLEGSTDFLPQYGWVGRAGLWDTMISALGPTMNRPQLQVNTTNGSNTWANIQVNDDRKPEYAQMIRDAINEY